MHVFIDHDDRHSSTRGSRGPDFFLSDEASSVRQHILALQLVFPHDIVDAHAPGELADDKLHRHPRSLDDRLAEAHFGIDRNPWGNLYNHNFTPHASIQDTSDGWVSQCLKAVLPMELDVTDPSRQIEQLNDRLERLEKLVAELKKK
jgi:hypothetical protein